MEIQSSLKVNRKRKQANAAQLELHREAAFEAFYASHIDKRDSLFQTPGLNFLEFTSSKITFTFEPRQLVRFVNKKVMFYCTLVRRRAGWSLKRDTFPINYKLKIYDLFYADAVTESNLILIIMGMYNILKHWAVKEDRFKRNKFKRYKRGEDVRLYSEDEELILDAAEVEERRTKRTKILEPPSNM